MNLNDKFISFKIKNEKKKKRKKKREFELDLIHASVDTHTSEITS